MDNIVGVGFCSSGSDSDLQDAIAVLFGQLCEYNVYRPKIKEEALFKSRYKNVN